MQLEEQMFNLITQWQLSKLKKKDFLSDKSIGTAKFDYWLHKFNLNDKLKNKVSQHATSTDFIPVSLASAATAQTNELTKIIELKTTQGIVITIFEKC